MADDAQTVNRFQATPNINLPAALAALNIEFLTVSDQRLFVIYANSILDITVSESGVQDTKCFEVIVLDYGSRGIKSDPSNLIEGLINRLIKTTDSNFPNKHKVT